MATASPLPLNVKIVHGGETRYSDTESWQSVCDELIAKHGPGIPQVETVAVVPVAEIREAQAFVPPVAPVALVFEGVSAEGQARSEADLKAAREAGFAPAQCLYTRGTRVNQTGVENARQSRVEYDEKPYVTSACQDLILKIDAEDRKDETRNVADVRMAAKDNHKYLTGDLVLNPGQSNMGVFAVEEKALPGLVSRLGMPTGAGTYLAQVYPELRAMNVNQWCTQWAEDEKEERAENPEAATETLVLRTRVTGGTTKRQVFAAVSERYTAFDIDRIAEAVRIATPPEARGSITYDGYKARFEVLFHSNVQPEDYVCGEFFKAGVIISTDDTGGGSLRGNSVVWQNLCLNLIVIDKANEDIFRIRHMGSVQAMAREFQKGFEQALNKISHFVKAWGYACKEDIRQYIPAKDRGISMAEAFPGFWNGILERELVPVRGKRPEVLKQLQACWDVDNSSATQHHSGYTRAALANAFTRFAHTVPQPSPWAEDEIQRAAGALVYSHDPIPYLPFVPFEKRAR